MLIVDAQWVDRAKRDELEQKMIDDEITNESEETRIDSEMKAYREKLQSLTGGEPGQEEGKEE